MADSPTAWQILRAEIEADARETARYTGRAQFAPAVLEAMERVPRDRFIPEAQQPYAWENRPLPIGHGQTISQPYIVALMTDLLDLAPGDRVLELGFGCGYQTAILAEMGAEVYGLEIVPELAATTRERLAAMGYTKLHLACGDGHTGWPEAAPFAAILVAAAAQDVPPALPEQLAPGGRLVIPLGQHNNTWLYTRQQLLRYEKQADGSLSRERVLPVAFVPFVEGNQG